MVIHAAYMRQLCLHVPFKSFVHQKVLYRKQKNEKKTVPPTCFFGRSSVGFGIDPRESGTDSMADQARNGIEAGGHFSVARL